MGPLGPKFVFVTFEVNVIYRPSAVKPMGSIGRNSICLGRILGPSHFHVALRVTATFVLYRTPPYIHFEIGIRVGSTQRNSSILSNFVEKVCPHIDFRPIRVHI